MVRGPYGAQTLRGRMFTPQEIELIQELVSAHPDATRRALSLEICRQLQWKQPNGRLKDRACRDVLLQLAAEQIVELPAPRYQWRRRGEPVARTARGAPQPPRTRRLAELAPVRLRFVGMQDGVGDRDEDLWDELIDRYHFLGFAPIVGHQAKYLIECDAGPLGCIGFGSAAWQVLARDEWIGWSDQQRRTHLALVVNNVRFLVLPWWRVESLASHVLSLAVRRVQHDWVDRYVYRPVLMETFVDRDRHRGTCYAAANWVRLGETSGRGKWNRQNPAGSGVKIVFVLPLTRNARRRLCIP